MKELIIKNGDDLKTTSLIIADEFRKKHETILKAIRNLECSQEFRLVNFNESSYKNLQGKEQK